MYVAKKGINLILLFCEIVHRGKQKAYGAYKSTPNKHNTNKQAQHNIQLRHTYAYNDWVQQSEKPHKY